MGRQEVKNSKKRSRRGKSKTGRGEESVRNEEESGGGEEEERRRASWYLIKQPDSVSTHIWSRYAASPSHRETNSSPPTHSLDARWSYQNNKTHLISMQSYFIKINADLPRGQKWSYTARASLAQILSPFILLLFFLNLPFGPIRLTDRALWPQLMQTSRGKGRTHQATAQTQTCPNTVRLKWRPVTLGASEWARSPFVHSRHVLCIILGVWTHRIWYYFRTVIINRLGSSGKDG